MEKAAAAPPVQAKANKITEEEISPNEYFKLRTTAIDNLKSLGGAQHPYPHKYHVTISLENFIEKYSYLKDNEVLESDIISVAGRVHAIRASGAKLIFYDLRGEGTKLQVMATAKQYEKETDFEEDTDKLKRGK